MSWALSDSLVAESFRHQTGTGSQAMHGFGRGGPIGAEIIHAG